MPSFSLTAPMAKKTPTAPQKIPPMTSESDRFIGIPLKPSLADFAPSPLMTSSLTLILRAQFGLTDNLSILLVYLFDILFKFLAVQGNLDLHIKSLG